MVRMSRWLTATVVALVLLTAGAAHAQTICYSPAPVAVAPVTSYYYAPAPAVTSYYAAPAPVVAAYYAPAPVVTSYYAAPVASYYAPAAGATTYRYGPLGRLRSVSSYYGAPGVVRYGYYYP